MTSLPDPRMRVRGGARGFYHTANAGPIRSATGLGGGFAFALMCIEFARANTATNASVSLRIPCAHDLCAVLMRYGPFAGVLALLLLAAVGWRNAWKARASLRRVAETVRVAEGEWQCRQAAAEVREHAARVASSAQTVAAVSQEREHVYAAVRDFVSGPLSALAGSAGDLCKAVLPAAQRPLVNRTELGLRASICALDDLFASASPDLRAVVLDENPLNPRELIEGVAALFAPAAARKGWPLSVKVERSVAASVLADAGRVGQILFHLLSRSVHGVRLAGKGEIAVLAWAVPINNGSQRVFISVRERRLEGGVSAEPVQIELAQTLDQSHHQSLNQPLNPPFNGGMHPSASHNETGPALAICERLAQHMHGGLTVSGEPGSGICTFNASFAIESVDVPATSTHAEQPLPLHAIDPAYLHALTSEGIELAGFLRGWRQSISNDLLHLRRLRDSHDIPGLRASLHRLSGAVSLVGARALMEALQRASVAQPEPDAPSIEALAKALEALMMELDHVIDPQRSNVL